MKFQLEKPLTAAKQGMMVVVALVTIYVTLGFFPDVIGGESIPIKFLVCGIIWFGYGLIWLCHTYFLPEDRRYRSFQIAILAFIVLPMWVGIAVTNWFFGDSENEQ